MQKVMPYIQPLTDDQAPETVRSMFRAIQRRFGMVPNIFRTMAHRPPVLNAVLRLNAAVQDDLLPKFRELAYLRTSLLNGCEYCSHYHRMAAVAAGVNEWQLDGIESYEFSDAFDAQEKAVLRFAEQLTLRADADEETIRKLKQFLTDSEFVALTAAVGLANFTNRFNHACGVELP